MGDLRQLFRKWLFPTAFSIGLVIGLGLLGSQALQEYGYRDATWTTGVVVDNVERVRETDDGVERTWAPVITWTDDTGTKRTFRSPVSTNPAHEIGSSMDVRYVPGEPGSVADASFGGRWIKGIIGGATTLVFGLLAWLTWPGHPAGWRPPAPRRPRAPARTKADSAAGNRTGTIGLKIAGAAFAALAVGALVLGGFALAAQLEYRDAVQTQGRVVDRVPRDGLVAPVLEYTDETGEPHRFTSGTSRSAAPAIGSELAVEYRPGDPASVRETSFTTRWLFVLLSGVGCAVFAIPAFLFFWFARRMARGAAPGGATTVAGAATPAGSVISSGSAAPSGGTTRSGAATPSDPADGRGPVA